MAEEAAAHHLLNVLEERELSVDLDKVLAVFEDDETKQAAAAWVREYLNEETLLTKEELELYSTLQKKGLIRRSDGENELVRPILDLELSTAIGSLQSSTAAIEEQCKILEAQRDALAALQALDKPNLSVEHVRNERRRRENQEKARLDIAVEVASTSIHEQLTDAEGEIEGEKSSLHSYLEERLASDDKMLTALPGIVSKIVSDPGLSEDERSVEQWCQAIVSFRTAEVKARVDAVFLNSITDWAEKDLPDASEKELHERKSALQAELETLHSEIASVAEMVVEHELKKPMTELRERKERDKEQARVAWKSYVLSTLEYMSKRLDTVAAHATDINEFQHALAHIGAAAKQRVPDVSEAAHVTPSRRRATSGTLSAFTPTINLKPPKSLKLPVALEDALRQTGISFNHESIESLHETIMRAQLEREQKLENHYKSSTSSTHEHVATRTNKADSDLRRIMDALYSHTPFQQIHLTDPHMGQLLDGLEKELVTADRKLLDAETNEISKDDPKVRAFIAKYGAGRK